MDPSFISSYLRMVPIYEQMGEFRKAVEALERAAALQTPDAAEYAKQAALLRKAYDTKGAPGYWQQELKLLDREKYPGNLIPSAFVYTRLGKKDDAFRCLDKAANDRVPYLIWDLPDNPAFDELRSDPRYADLLRRLLPRSN